MRKLKLFFAFLLMSVLSIGQVWGAADLTISADFSSSNVFNMNTSGNDASSRTDMSDGTYTYYFYASNACYFTTNKLFIGKTGSYIEFPAISGKKLTKVTIVPNSGTGGASLTICHKDSTVATPGGASQSLSNGSTTPKEWTLTHTTANTAYKVLLGGNKNAHITSWSLEYTNVGGGGSSNPTISADPVSATYGVDDDATVLSVTATASEGDLSYEWFSNSSESTEGATSVATTETYKPSTSSAGTTYYYCVVTDDNGSATSDFAEIVVKDKFVVTWSVNGVETPTYVLDGDKPVFPATPVSCDLVDSKFFVGWSTSSWTGKLENLNEKTVYTTAAAMPAVTGAGVKYYAVFAKATDKAERINATSQLYHGVELMIVDARNSKVLTTTPGVADAPTEDAGGKVNVTDSYMWTLEGAESNWKLKTGTAYLSASATSSSTPVALNETNDVWQIEISGSTTYSNCFYLRNTAGEKTCLEYNDSWMLYNNNGYASSNYFAEKLYIRVYTDFITTCCTKYAITLAGDPAGTVTGGTFVSDAASVCEDETVTITATPGSAYTFGGITVAETANPTNEMDESDIIVDENTAAFDMPAYPVTVTAIFNAKSCTKLDDPENIVVSGKAYPYNAVSIAWDEVANAEYYAVEILKGSETIESDFVEATVAHGYNITHTLLANTEYTYRIQATVETEGTYCNSDVVENIFTTDALPKVHVTYNENGETTNANTAAEPAEGRSIQTAFALPNSVSNECSKAFVGWSTVQIPVEGDEPTSNYYKAGANFTIESNEDVTLYAVYASGSAGQAWTLTSTDIDAVGSASSGYGKYNGDQSKSGITYNTYQIMPQSSNIQFQSGNGVMYNKTAFAQDIESITINGIAASNISVYEGSEAISSTPGSGAITRVDGSYPFTSGKKYFRLVMGSATGTASSISVTLKANYSNYSTTCQAKVAQPSYEGAENGQTYEVNKTIAITAVTGATIYYTMSDDGNAPADPAVDPTNLYADPIELAANGTYKFKAFAVKEGFANSDIASFTVTIDKPLTLAQFMEAKPNTDKKVDLTGAVILGKTTDLIFVQQGEAAVALYKSNHGKTGWIYGQKINGIVTGKYNLYHAMPQLSVTSFGEASVLDADAGDYPTPIVVTAENKESMMVVENAFRLMKMENVNFGYESSNLIVTFAGGSEYNYYEDELSILSGKTIPMSETSCDVLGILYPWYESGNSYGYNQLAPFALTNISTKGAYAPLPSFTIGEPGGNNVAQAVEIVSGTEIKLTAAEGTTATYKIGEETPAEVSTEGTSFNISGSDNDVIVLTTTSVRDFYGNNSGDYYYKINNSLAPHAINKADVSNGSFAVKNADASAVINTAVAGVKVTLVPTADPHYHFVSWSVCETATPANTIDVDANNQFEMPGVEVTVSATFAPNPTYAISGAGTDANGNTVTVVAEAEENDEITITLTPAANYHYTSISAKDADEAPVTLTEVAEGETYTFTMPAKAVTITTVFTEDDKYTVTWYNNGAEYTTTNVYAGSKPVFPTTAPTSCDGTSTTFIGWTQTTWEGKQAESYVNGLTTEATKVYKTSAAMPEVSAEVAYHAVYAKVGSLGLATSIADGDVIYLATLATSTENPQGVTGYNGTKDATISETFSEWMPFTVTAVTGGYNLSNGDNNVQAASSSFKVTSDPASLLTFVEESGNHDHYRMIYTDNSSKNYALGINSTSTTNRRFYNVTNSYTWFYVHKIPADDYMTTCPPAVHTITYNSESLKGQSVAGYPTEYTEGVGIPSFEPLADVDGFNFAGWSPASIGTDATTDIEMFATWTPSTTTYNVTYASAHGTAPIAETAASVTLQELTEAGWTHTGWTANVDVEVDDATVTVGALIANGKTAVLSADVAFTAVWVEKDLIRDGLSNGKWGTLCPTQNVENVEGAEFYQISHLVEKDGLPYNMVFEAISGTTLTAGQPYFFIANANEIRGNKTGDAEASGSNKNGFYGYIGVGDKALPYEADYNVSHDNTYVIYNNSVYRITGATDLKSGRCYININSTEPSRTDQHASSGAPRRRITMQITNSNAATGMENAEASEAPIKMMIDGQLFILRGERLYDATGRLVK